MNHTGAEKVDPKAENSRREDQVEMKFFFTMNHRNREKTTRTFETVKHNSRLRETQQMTQQRLTKDCA